MRSGDDEVLALALRLTADARNMQRNYEELRQMNITISSWSGNDIKIDRNNHHVRISQGRNIVTLSIDQGRALVHAILTVLRAVGT